MIKLHAANIRIGYMAGLSTCHWAVGMLLGFGPGGRKLIGHWYLLEIFYLYRA